MQKFCRKQHLHKTKIQRLKDLEAENKALRKALAEKTEAVEILIPKGQRKKSVGIILKP